MAFNSHSSLVLALSLKNSHQEIRHENACYEDVTYSTYSLSDISVSEGVMMHCVAEQYVLVTPDPQDSKSIISVSFPACCCGSCCLLLLATKKAYHSKERNLFITYSASRRKARLAEKVILFFVYTFAWAERNMLLLHFPWKLIFCIFSGNHCCIFRNKLV